MFNVRKSIIILGFVSCCLQAQGADKYTDENRPYEFGFTIDGEQHRHEKKDENGIIMGEFGFITADGVYHVTVYATDENGNFKILSMKNIRVKPYPTAPGAEKTGHSLPFPPSQNPPKTQGPTPSPVSPAKSCSSCSIPTTRAPAITDYANVARNDEQYGKNPSTGSRFGGSQSTGSFEPQKYPTGQQSGLNYPQQGANYPQQGAIYPQQGLNYPQQGSNYPQPGANYPQQGANYPQQGPNYSQGGGSGQQSNPNYPQSGIPGQQNAGGSPGTHPAPNYQGLLPPYGDGESPNNQYSGQNSGAPRDRNPKRIDNYPQQSPQGSIGHPGSAPQKPTLISAQMQIVDKNTDIYHKNPGEKDGLPEGLTKGDMVKLLYTFNYTVGFHAHFEEGYTDGSKQGYYYVTGRNGVRTRVDYVADEKGFRPKITEEILDLLSDDVPKPETEKDEKFGLKGYEFKWLYYPEESKGR